MITFHTPPPGRIPPNRDWKCQKTNVRRGVAIGSGTLFGGITVVKKALTGAGSLVTKDVPGHEMDWRNPARILRKSVKNNASKGAVSRS